MKVGNNRESPNLFCGAGVVLVCHGVCVGVFVCEQWEVVAVSVALTRTLRDVRSGECVGQANERGAMYYSGGFDGGLYVL